ncbi:MAG TPA: hydantoinase/oxoprolinase family protein, partial [Candidatus Limnocylindrales bacterium]|nr:hydantoinase/oxoprolinase family protein [Candidatus Limnocylindrales bacterium]
LEHQTSVRSLDVRVVGVAGGSLMRVSRRLGRLRVSDVGPRSAHIAGLSHASFAAPETLIDAHATLVAPRAGDADDYVVVQAADGRTFAATVTCAANALGDVAHGSYASGNTEAARLAFEAVGKLVGDPWDGVARRVLALGTGKIADVVEEIVTGHRLRSPLLVGIGGGAGALLPTLGAKLRLEWRMAPDAEILSSIGDALSLIRVEIERGATQATPELISALHREAEDQAINAGAAPESIQVESERLADRAAIRVTATGTAAGLAPLADGTSAADCEAAAEHALRRDVDCLAADKFALFVPVGAYRNEYSDVDFALVDQRAGIAATGRGRVLVGLAADAHRQLDELLPTLVRHIGPLSVAPAVKLVRGGRLVDLTSLSKLDDILAAVANECVLASDAHVMAIVTRS